MLFQQPPSSEHESTIARFLNSISTSLVNASVLMKLVFQLRAFGGAYGEIIGHGNMLKPSSKMSDIIPTMSSRHPEGWRLILSKPLSGAENMALDEAILEAVGAGDSAPTLRLYAWNPPCLSLGFAQAITDVDQKRLSEQGWDIVRRPTGGRAILHTDELTYSILAPADHPHLKGDVLSSYRYLSTGLIKGLELMGVETEVQPSKHPTKADNIDDPVCFVASSAYEITHGGKKLLGSAQTRRKNSILQHGTLPLTGDIARICTVLVYVDEPARRQAARQVLERATTLEHASTRIVSWDEAARAMVDGFASALGIEFTETPATSAELRRAEVLASERYQNPAWTERA